MPLPIIVLVTWIDVAVGMAAVAAAEVVAAVAEVSCGVTVVV